MSPSCESTDPKPSSDIGTPSGEPQPTNLSVHAGKWGNLTFESARQRYVGHTRDPQRNGLLEPRNLVLGVNGRIGSLCDCLRRSAAECSRGLPAFSRSDKDMIALELGSAVVLIMLLAEQCNIDLPLAVLRKIELNAKKYPAALVRGSALKYDAYREHTGFDRDVKQVTTEGSDGQAHLEGHVEREWTNLTLQDLRQHLQAFAQERGWDKFHTPRNICMALSGEVGELCEVFQWRDEEKCCAGLPGWTSEARDNLAQEISDVCIYLCRLSDLCDVDLTDALLDTRTLRFL